MGYGGWCVPGWVPVVWVRVWCLAGVLPVFGCLASVLPVFGCLAVVLPEFGCFAVVFTRIWLFCQCLASFLAVLPVFGLISGCFASFLAVWPHTRLFGLIPGCLASYPAVWPPWWYRPGLSVLRFTRSRESCSLRLRVRVVYKTSFHLEMT